MNYFDLSRDPLNLVADRAAVALFLRGDMKTAPHSVAIAMTKGEVTERLTRGAGPSPDWNALALVTRVGTFVADAPGRVPADVVIPLGPAAGWSGASAVLALDPYAAATGGRVLDLLRARGWLARDAVDLSLGVLRSETGELTVDAPRDVLLLDTPRTSGVYAPEGEAARAGALAVEVLKTDATVFATSLDGRPLASSGRVLLAHLTDLQNTGARFAERRRRTLLEWGSLPHLVLAGRAEVALSTKGRAAEAWALTTGGRRKERVECRVSNGAVSLALDVAGPSGARLIYEVLVR
jgi:hypothetical protein